MSNEKIYNIGDKTPSGWEVVDRRIIYSYVTRKRIKITTNYKFHKYGSLKNKKGWFYFDNGYKWVELDNGIKIRLQENEYEYID